MNTRSDTSLNPQSICGNALTSALRAWGWSFLFLVVALGGFVATGGENDNLNTGPSPLAPRPGNLQEWTAARDARIAEKQHFLAKVSAAPTRSEVTEETAPMPLGATPKYSSSTGVENFEAAWPDCYWTVTGLPTWNDVSCFTPYQGSWSAYCAGSSSSCAGYVNNMDAVMYTECQYAGTLNQGNNRLYWHLNIPSIESCCDYLEITFQGYTNQPPHGAVGTPTATYSFRWTSATSGWEGWQSSLGSDFDPCFWVRVTFRFHSDSSNIGQGAYLDYIEFNNLIDTDIYPICGGFAPCTYSVSPTSGSIAACGGSTSVSVSADSGCSWTASTPCSSWLTVSPSSGSGSGTVSLSAIANNSGSSRSCTLAIAGTSYTVTQPSASISLYEAWWSNTTDVDGDGCVEGVARLNWDADYSCSGSVSVFANVYYKASTESTWILSDASPCYTISGASGSDGQYMDFLMWDGTWDYRIDLLYCGETTVQDTFELLGHCEETCGYSISPTGGSHGAGAGSGSFSVVAGSGCTWAAATSYAWIHTTSTGSGNGTVSFTMDANTIANSRLGTITVGDRAYTVSQAPSSATSSVVFSDSFDDNTIDASKWTTYGNTVTESSQVMQVLTMATDAGGNLASRHFPVNSTGKITITRRAYLHYANNYFMANFMVNVGTLPGFRVQYCNDHYASGANYMARYGFCLTRNEASAMFVSSQGNVSAMITPIWDGWFTEKIAYDPLTGVMEYFTNDVSALSYNVGLLPQTNSPTMTLSFNAWGWWTGHQQLFDDLVVAQASPVSMLPQLGELSVSSGVFRFNLRGHVGSSYVIQVSANLVNWQPLVTNMIPAGGSVPITGPATGQAKRFYRAVLVP